MSEDSSGRERLRDAAIESLARRGLDATVREIATDAGVTAGLITYHFGARARLRAECDAEVLRRIRELNEDGLRRSPEQQLAMLGEIDAQGSTVAYALRLVREGGPAAREFMEQMIADTLNYLEAAVVTGVVKPSRDPVGRARYLVAAQLGGLLLHADLLGLDLSDGPKLVRRIAAGTTYTALELYTDGLLANRSLLDQYLAGQEAEKNS
jgi:AcrR family transcriptional regulator